jgi:hypothetical protein
MRTGMRFGLNGAHCERNGHLRVPQPLNAAYFEVVRGLSAEASQMPSTGAAERLSSKAAMRFELGGAYRDRDGHRRLPQL